MPSIPLKLLEQAISSAGTSLKQVPAVFKKDYFAPNTRNIDIGGGAYDLGTDYLASKGVASQVFDPFNRSQAHNEAVFESLLKNGPADTATVANVLNVVREPEVRKNIIHQANRAIKPEGKAYFQIYEGVPKNKGVGSETSKGWQNNLPTSAYVDDVKEFFDVVKPHGNIIEASKPKDMGKASWLMSKNGPVKQYAIPVGVGLGTLASAGFLPDTEASAKSAYINSPEMKAAMMGIRDEPVKDAWNPVEALATAPIGAFTTGARAASVGIDALLSALLGD